MKLIAQKYILFESKMYAPGKELPTNNADMVKAWLAAGTAVDTDAEEKETTTVAKAKAKTAESGLAGEAVASESEDGEDLVGKVPKTTSRSRKK